MSEDGRSEATKRTYQQFLGKDTDEIELQLHKKKARREGFEMEIKILQRKMLKSKNEEEGLRRALEDTQRALDDTASDQHRVVLAREDQRSAQARAVQAQSRIDLRLSRPFPPEMRMWHGNQLHAAVEGLDDLDD